MKASRGKVLAIASALLVLLGLLVEAQVTCIGGGCGRPFREPILIQDGTVSLPSLAFETAPTLGLYKQSATILGVGTAAAPGNIWLGTASIGQVDVGRTSDLFINRGGVGGSLRINGGTTPTQSGTTCGTGPTITGSNRTGSITLGTTPGLPCTIVFNGTWGQTPRCWLNPEVLATATTTLRATSITTTGFVATSTAALVATDKFSWFCESNN